MSGREQRIPAALALVVGAAVWLGWVAYAAFIATVTLAGENCSDASRSTCSEADAVYGGLQVALTVVGTVLAWRAFGRGYGFVSTGSGQSRARSAALPAAVAFGAWVVLVGGRIATAGHPW